MNALDKYIQELEPSCWLNSQHVNGYGEEQPDIDEDVNTWVDISGSGNDFYFESYVAEDNPPKFNASTLFNKTHDCIKFTSSDRTSLRVSQVNTLWEDSLTLILVCNNGSGGTTFQMGTGGSILGNLLYRSYGLSSRVDNASLEGMLPFYKTEFNITIVKRALGVFTGQSTYSKNSFLLKINNTPVTSPALSSSNVDANPSLGCRKLRDPNRYDDFDSVDIIEFISFNRILNDSETSQVQTYIKLKYNI